MFNRRPETAQNPPDQKRFWLEVGVTSARYLIFLIITGVLAWRILHADFSWIQITQFDFSQVLTLLLAFFSILLSAMFYFRATQTSSEFYNRTYEFTKDFVDRLTRIEEGFGGLLKNIHEDTSQTRDFMQSGGQPKTFVPTGATAAAPHETSTAPSDTKEK